MHSINRHLHYIPDAIPDTTLQIHIHSFSELLIAQKSEMLFSQPSLPTALHLWSYKESQFKPTTCNHYDQHQL